MIEKDYISYNRHFMTSLEVIRDVMNVPMEAVHAIARINGISTADDHERNITEKELQPFIEAFERKTRNYFVNSMRNRARLTPQELQTFTEFCKTFKKGNVSLGRVSNWSHIGKTKLRQYFVDKIKEKTPSSSSPLFSRILDLFSGCGWFEIGSIEPVLYGSLGSLLVRHIGISEYDSEYSNEEYHERPSRDLLEQITSSWQYQARIEERICFVELPTNIVNQIVRSARYYVYIDDDDYHEATVIRNRKDHFINSTRKVVA